MKLRLNDTIKVTLGKDRGRTGKIEAVLPKKNAVVVTDINQYKKHLKSRDQNQPSSIITITKPLAVSKLALLCPHCHQPTRVGYLLKNNQKLRICKKCQKPIDGSVTVSKKTKK